MATKAKQSSIAFATQADSYVLAFASNGRATRTRTMDNSTAVVPALFTPFPISDVVRWETRTERGCSDAIRAYLKSGAVYACLPSLVSIDPLQTSAYWVRVEGLNLGLLLDVAEQDRRLSTLLNSREDHIVGKVDIVDASEQQRIAAAKQNTARIEQEAAKNSRVAAEKAAPALDALSRLRAGLGIGERK